MAASDHTDETAQDSQANDRLTRFANVIGAVFFGLLVTGALLWLLAAGLQLAGGGIWYALMFILATGFGYRGAKQLTEDQPALRLPIVAVGVGAIALACANWRSLGFEDPFVAPLVFAVFLMLGYFFTGEKGPPEKSWKSEMEDQLADQPPTDHVATDQPPADHEPTEEAPAISDAAQASVTLYRKSSMLSMEVVYYVSCDEKPIARIADGCRTTVQVPAGKHGFTLSDEYGKCTVAPIHVSLAPDEEVFFDCTFRSLWSGVAFKTVPHDEAQREMAGLVSAA